MRANLINSPQRPIFISILSKVAQRSGFEVSWAFVFEDITDQISNILSCEKGGPDLHWGEWGPCQMPRMKKGERSKYGEESPLVVVGVKCGH